MAAAMHLYFQCLLGIQCEGFTLVAADQTNTQSIIVMSADEDKVYEISDKLVMGLNGDVGDRSQFSQFVLKNLELYKMKNKYKLDTAAVAHFTKKNMTDALQNGTPYILNVLMGGFDEAQGAQLYTLDLLATCLRVPFATHGFAGLFGLSILSHYYRPDLTEAQAYDILKLCVSEVHKRLFVSLPNFCVKSISKDGVKTLPIISANSVVL